MNIQIHNALTNEITIEPISDKEAAYIAQLTQAEKDKETQAAQAATDKTALLAKLGISADEAKLLLN